MSADPSLARIRGVLFDVDGTLYHARPLQIRMALALLALPLSGFSRARRTWRHIKSYRRALEEVRYAPKNGVDAATQHLRRAAELAGDDIEALQSTVDEWLARRPLPHLLGCRRAGLVEFLDELRRREIQIGFFSDYPVAAKLEALQIDGYGSVCVSASDPGINAYKPLPDGFQRASELFDLPAAEILYVGDRPEVDAVGAANAGMRCAILGSASAPPGSDFIAVPGFADLMRVLQELS